MKNVVSILHRWGLAALLGGLLACQSTPSDDELLRLYLLGDELTGLNDQIGKANGGSVKGIQAQVEKSHNQPAEVAILHESEAVHAEAQQLVAYLRDLQQQQRPAGTAPTLDWLADHRPVAAMLDDGRADSLQRRLSRYAAHMQPYLRRRIRPVAGGADERLQPLLGEQGARLGFAGLYFQGATVAEALVALAQQEAQVLRLDADVLLAQSQRVGPSVIIFNRISASASAESNVVEEGESYRAELFLTASASGIQPKMTANGQPVPVGRDGKEQVAFTAPPLPPGRSRRAATWLGTLTIRTNGRDSTFRVQVPYTIVRRR